MMEERHPVGELADAVHAGKSLGEQIEIVRRLCGAYSSHSDKLWLRMNHPTVKTWVERNADAIMDHLVASGEVRQIASDHYETVWEIKQ